MLRAVIFLLISSWVVLSAALSKGTRSEAEVESILLGDSRIPIFVDGRWSIMSDRQIHSGQRSAATMGHRSTSTSTSTSISTSKSTSTTATTTTTAAASPLPSPFDGALAANFSSGQTCPNFINAFLSDPTFKSCYPVSLLLQGSRSFFEAEKSFFSITRVLDAACAANVDTCKGYFDALASRLIDDATCGKDYELGNALVVDAYMGMRTYETVYRATCLMSDSSDSSHSSSSSSPGGKNFSSKSDPDPDPDGGDGGDADGAKTYCFANAVTNRSTPSNAYLYYLPFNHTLPPTSAPACGSCTKQTMQIYQAATADRKSDIASSYAAAASQINAECGPGFVNTTLAAAVVGSSATASSGPPPSGVLVLCTLALAVVSRWMS
ncbi:hypothetical protein F5Y17DRAFT_468659 [Xylariaceae sp. FL0594]|nr:hypothetical protein F5Y17DRAFT_468659 [Xylariaceae sp. FL0594]